MAALLQKREKLAISGFLRQLDQEESEDIQRQRHQFKEFIKVLSNGPYFKGTKQGTDAYRKKLEGARAILNKQYPDQQIESVDVLKVGYGSSKGISSSKKHASIWNSLINEVYTIFASIVIADQFDKFYSNIALKTDGKTLQRITKESNWYTGFGTEYVKKGQTRSWKVKLITAETAAFFKGYIGICDVNKCDPKMQGPVSDTKNCQYSMHCYTGNKCHESRDGKPYAARLGRGKVVEMTLSLKVSKGNKGKTRVGTLKYSVDGKNYGVAFDDVDVSKCYKLAISVQNRETYSLV